MRFNPKTCYTASIFRLIGVVIDPGVPDEAWLPRSAVTWENIYARREGKKVVIGLRPTILQPWRRR